MSKKIELPECRDYHLNDKEGKIHKYIEEGNEEMVKKLIEHGVKMCTAPGQNCFMIAQSKWGWKFVKKLLEYDSDGVFVENNLGQTLLMIYANNRKIMKRLLDIGANHSGRSTLNQETVLMHALDHPRANFKSVKCLLEAGADPNMIVARTEPSKISKTVLSCAFKNKRCFNIEIIKMLFEKVDFNANDYQCEYLIEIAFKKYFNMLGRKAAKNQAGVRHIETNRDRQLISIIQYLFEHPHIQSTHHLYNPQIHPQYLIMSKWVKYLDFDLPEFFFDSNLVIVNQIITQNLCFPISKYKCGNINFLPLSLFLQTLGPVYTDFRRVVLFLEDMLSLGYGFYHPDTISPLVVILMTVRPEPNVQVQFFEERYKGEIKEDDVYERSSDCDFLKLIKLLINNGTHIGQIGFWDQDFSRNREENYKTLKQETYVPDAICSAVDSGNFTVLRMLLPYFGGPPLSLLTFPSADADLEFDKLFAVLAEWGPLPLGSTLLSSTTEAVCELEDNEKLSGYVYDLFYDMHHSPPSLMHLCRCEIRQNLSEKASRPGNNLPDLILQISPPGLRDFLLMKPSEPMNYVFCKTDGLATVATYNELSPRSRRRRLFGDTPDESVEYSFSSEDEGEA